MFFTRKNHHGSVPYFKPYVAGMSIPTLHASLFLVFGKRKKGNLFIKDFLTKNLPDYSGGSRGDTKGFKILCNLCDSGVSSIFHPFNPPGEEHLLSILLHPGAATEVHLRRVLRCHFWGSSSSVGDFHREGISLFHPKLPVPGILFRLILCLCAIKFLCLNLLNLEVFCFHRGTKLSFGE